MSLSQFISVGSHRGGWGSATAGARANELTDGAGNFKMFEQLPSTEIESQLTIFGSTLISPGTCYFK